MCFMMGPDEEQDVDQVVHAAHWELTGVSAAKPPSV